MNMVTKRPKIVLSVLIVVAVLLAVVIGVRLYTPLDIFSDVDFEESPYKHLNNGGIEGDDPMPYNIDAIAGATVTVEGPALVTSIPLSMRELENRTEGLVRGTYKDGSGVYSYEGIDLQYLLHDMVDGDNGIILTDSAYRVVLKDCDRADVTSFTLEEVQSAHDAGRPILLAYGIGTADTETVAPFVFDAANEDEHSAGYLPELENDDGCLRLVYDMNRYGAGQQSKAFTNVAYVYLCEETEPGFKHTAAEDGDYSRNQYTDYIVTFRGDALGQEMNFTIRELEDLVSYNKDGTLVEGGVGYSDFYSLANNAYWYVNEYEGLDLYKLLVYLGMDDAETMGAADARTTLVSFVANDGVPAPESFSVETLSYPDAFGYYIKNAADNDDGSYVPTNADLEDTGYPVLLAYGVNNYPYTIAKGDEGYLSGLSNNGGPLRTVFGKTQYNHANGSNQVQYLRDVVVGEDTFYSTHLYTNNSDQAALAENKLNITATAEDGDELLKESYTVGAVEDLIYGANRDAEAVKEAQVKNSYQVKADGDYVTDVYEGVNLIYFLMDVLGLPGTNGTIRFSGADGALEVNLDTLFNNGYNTELGGDDLVPLLAFAKNGAPLVEDAKSPGYVDAVPLYPLLNSEPDSYHVQNSGGPLAILLPSSDAENCNAEAVLNVTDISIELIPDAYAHIEAPYSALADNTLRIYGDGLDGEKTFTVADIGGMQTKVRTADYSVLDSKNNHTEERYRGIAVYELFSQIGLMSNAGDVTVYASDGTTQVLSLSQIKRQNFKNYLSPDKPDMAATLAYGVGKVGEDTMLGCPLVPSDAAPGYNADFGNGGGPLKLIVPQQDEKDANAALCVKDVVAIEVAANEIDTWGHHMSDLYEEYLDYTFTLTVRNDDNEWSHDFTLEELEAMTKLISRDDYSVLEIGECEGIALWELVNHFAKEVPGIDKPISVTAYAEDGYKNDLLSVFHLDGLKNGVPNADGDLKPILLTYAVNGFPLVDEESHEGYSGLAGNMGGPLRIIAETVQGASVKYVNKVVVTVPGDGPINIKADVSTLS